MRSGASSGDLGFALSPSGRSAVDSGVVRLLLLAMVHLVEAVESTSPRDERRRRRQGRRIVAGRMSKHVAGAEERSILKDVEMVEELRMTLVLGNSSGVNDDVGRKEDGEVSGTFCSIPPSLDSGSGLVGVAHEVDDALDEEVVGQAVGRKH
jgi:hypothetical protein